MNTVRLIWIVASAFVLGHCATMDVSQGADDTDTAADSDADSDTDVDTDTDADSDTDTDTNTGEDPVPCTEENAEELCGDPLLCVDGYCCDTVCEGGCDACNLPGLEGVCSIQPDTFACREAAGLCDAVEYCDGASAECPADEILTAEDECRPAVNDCDVAELCDGSTADGCPADAFVAAAMSCGSSSSAECDAPDTCDGSGTCLPNNVIEDTPCGSSAATECDNPDTCDGSGSCAPNYESMSNPCGSSADSACDNPDTCDGSGACASNFEAAGESCGSTLETTCNHADTCNGSGACLTNFEPSTTVCRAAVNDCDLAESCDGSGSCPANAYKTSGATCGSTSDTECDNPDTCNGGGVCQPNYVSSGIACTTSTNPCELAAECNGSGECSGGGFVDEGTPCNSTSHTECDDPDTCDEFGECQTNWVGSGTACGASGTSACDNSDSCDGIGTCLENHVSSGVACGSPANTECTDPDSCNGSGTCLANDATSGTTCGDTTSTTCNAADTCNGSGTCLENFTSPSTVCRAAGTCDVAEYCDGSGSCPADVYAGSGTACGDGSTTTCTSPDSCNGSGTCLPNNTADGTSCGSSVTQYQCGGGTGCAAKPQSRSVSQHCQTGTCTPDTGVPWADLDTCASDEICLSNSGAAWCDLCDTFPVDYCSGGDAYHYGSTYGTCTTGSCTYTPTFEDCAYGCSGGVCVTCPGTVWSTNGHCYWYVATGATWDAAEAACVAQGGHLASITSSAENTFVLGLTTGDAWFGLRDYATATTALGNCDDCTNNCTAGLQRYTFDTCVGYDDQYFTCGGDGWNDFMFNFTPPSTQYYVFSTPTANRFAAISNYINDHSAYDACYGGVDYACGNPLIYSLTGGTTYLLQFDGTSSCGASTMDVRRFVFTDGQAHTYHNWGSGEPNNSSNTEDCAQLSDAAGTWNDLTCSTSMPYVCEKL